MNRMAGTVEPLHEYRYLVLQGQVKSGLVDMGNTRLFLAFC